MFPFFVNIIYFWLVYSAVSNVFSSWDVTYKHMAAAGLNLNYIFTVAKTVRVSWMCVRIHVYLNSIRSYAIFKMTD